MGEKVMRVAMGRWCWGGVYLFDCDVWFLLGLGRFDRRGWWMLVVLGFDLDLLSWVGFDGGWDGLV
jgi:hypothetical protein